jgi:hypothetical protein
MIIDFIQKKPSKLNALKKSVRMKSVFEINFENVTLYLIFIKGARSITA